MQSIIAGIASTSYGIKAGITVSMMPLFNRYQHTCFKYGARNNRTKVTLVSYLRLRKIA
ncbi:hypothetical protein [Lactobacillus amylovorus]|uniref:hypothetical protein n=1 Tax=Lactobacillus amylovorus TaxID=1604 RepID=UPI003F8AC1F0